MNCVECFREIGIASICPYCGTDQEKDFSERQAKHALPRGYRLGNQYELGKLLGAGGFGITYLARNLNDGSLAAVKEFYPAEFCARDKSGNVVPRRNQQVYNDSVDRFYQEAKTLHKLSKSPYVVHVLGFYKKNNTAYIAMEYVQGKNLAVFLKESGGRIPYNEAKKYIIQTALALNDVHRNNIIHSDVSPSNIIINKDGEIRLIDFGAAKANLHENINLSTIQLKPGFAPPEQYPGSKLQLGPWTDIYALACTFYRIATGKSVPSVSLRNNGEGIAPVSSIVSEADAAIDATIHKALELNYKKRYLTIDDFLVDFTIDEMTSVEFVPPVPDSGFFKKLFNKAKMVSLKKGSENFAYVEVIVGLHKGEKLNLNPGKQYLIGRQPDMCDLVVSSSSTISRVHCSLTYNATDGSVIVEDKSSNGSSVDDRHMIHNSSLKMGQSFLLALAGKEAVLRIEISRGSNT